MNWVTGLAIYFVLWWLVLFAVLPWGVRPVDPADVVRGHAAGAPQRPRLLAKMAATSAVAAIVWVFVYWLIGSGTVSFRT